MTEPERIALINEIGRRHGWKCYLCAIPLIPLGMESEFEFPVPEWDDVRLITTAEGYSTLDLSVVPPRLICHRCNAKQTESTPHV